MSNREHPHYTRHTVHKHTPSDTTAEREVWIPDEIARQEVAWFTNHLNWWILQAGLRGDSTLLEYATGGLPGCSVANNVVRHANNYHFFITDLSHAYESVAGAILADQLTQMGMFDDEEEAYTWLATYTMHQDGQGLVQGSPVSPLLFNLYCAPLDQKLGNLAESYGLVYTRYMDDLVFSAMKEAGPIGKHKRRRLIQTIETDGWKVAHHKTKAQSLDKPVVITGLSLDKTGHWRLSPSLIQRVTEALEALERKLQDGTEPITLHDIGVIDGYHGVVTSSYDARRGRPTEIERELLERYHELRRQASLLLARSAVHNR